MRAGTAGVLGVTPLPTHTSVMMARLGLDWSIAPPRRCAEGVIFSSMMTYHAQFLLLVLASVAPPV